MRFRDKKVVALIAPAILRTLKLPESHSPDMKKYREKVLACQCRELEKFLKFRKSVRAQKQADRLGIDDLARYAWSDQTKKKKMGDLGRKIFHFEHTMPVSVQVKKLLALKRPTLASVKAIISKAEVSWITKVEDKKLIKLKFRNMRYDPAKAYRAAGITLCEE